MSTKYHTYIYIYIYLYIYNIYDNQEKKLSASAFINLFT